MCFLQSFYRKTLIVSPLQGKIFDPRALTFCFFEGYTPIEVIYALKKLYLGLIVKIKLEYSPSFIIAFILDSNPIASPVSGLLPDLYFLLSIEM